MNLVLIIIGNFFFQVLLAMVNVLNVILVISVQIATSHWLHSVYPLLLALCCWLLACISWLNSLLNGEHTISNWISIILTASIGISIVLHLSSMSIPFKVLEILFIVIDQLLFSLIYLSYRSC